MYSEIASNKRRTIIFVGLFFVIWVAVGAVIGLAVRAIYQSASTQGLAPAHPTAAGWAPVFVGDSDRWLPGHRRDPLLLDRRCQVGAPCLRGGPG